ncbi:MAG: hypothetical protein F4Y18_03060 [Cenarchaeum sp. SB0663_bin_5]|nr:hypothetical protein [Cenarchaeum sp. SB0663_bin_5]
MNDLNNLLAKQEIIRNEIKQLREEFEKQQEKAYGEIMRLRDVEVRLTKYYEVDVRLADEIYKLTH